MTHNLHIQSRSKAQTCGLEQYVWHEYTRTLQVHMFVPYLSIACEDCMSSQIKFIITRPTRNRAVYMGVGSNFKV